MLIYVRLLCLDFKCCTFFWAAVYVECRTAQGLFECIEAHCEAMHVPIEKIFFYASDGASVAGLLRAKSAVLTSTHCLAHREALGMKDAVEQSEWAQWFDDWLHAQRSTAPAVGLMSSSKSGLLLLKTAANCRPPIRLGLLKAIR